MTRRTCYTSVDSADDIDAVRKALGIEKLDFYGVSYGTQVGQVYAVRHGDRLRTLVLDSAYPLTQRTDLFDFDRISGKALLIAVSRLCDRSFLCQKVGGNIDDRMRSLISRVRNQPVKGKSFSPIDGSKVPVTFDETALIEALSGYGFEPGQVEIDGAHAALRRGDAKPILRLGAEAICCPAPPDPTLLSVGDLLRRHLYRDELPLGRRRLAGREACEVGRGVRRDRGRAVRALLGAGMA